MHIGALFVTVCQFHALDVCTAYLSVCITPREGVCAGGGGVTSTQVCSVCMVSKGA